MRHPTEGTLRRLLDEPAGVADADRRHVGDCSSCLAALVGVRQDAAGVGAVLTADAADEADVSAAWQRLTVARAAQQQAPRPRATRAGPGRLAGLLHRPAAAALAVAVVLTGAGTAAANDWLTVFRTERVAPISLTTSDLIALPDLEAYGEIELTGESGVRSVPDAEVAADRTGLEVPDVTALPSGVSGEPIHQVVGEVSATFTFSAERAEAAAASSGEAAPPPPAGLDGASVRLEAGPGVAQIWTSTSGAPALIVGRAVAPTASASGAEFEVLRDYLLSLPGLPADVAAQLRTFSEDGSTLPLPLPAGAVTTTRAQVGGVPATVVQTRDRAFAGVVWVQDGMVTIVAGSLDPDEVLAVAQELG